jgi:hypothetical protein
MILNASAWDILTLQCIEAELMEDPDISPEQLARAIYLEVFRLIEPTPEERMRPN